MPETPPRMMRLLMDAVLDISDRGVSVPLSAGTALAIGNEATTEFLVTNGVCEYMDVGGFSGESAPVATE